MNARKSPHGASELIAAMRLAEGDPEVYRAALRAIAANEEYDFAARMQAGQMLERMHTPPMPLPSPLEAWDMVFTLLGWANSHGAAMAVVANDPPEKGGSTPVQQREMLARAVSVTADKFDPRYSPFQHAALRAFASYHGYDR